MKAIIKCIIDIKTLQVIEEEFYEYNGMIAMCKGGGGGAGKVSYPDFMGDWLGETLYHSISGADTITSSMTDVMNAALGNDPYIGEAAYNPDDEVAAMLGATNDFNNYMDALDVSLEWVNAYDLAIAKIDWDTWLEAYDIVKAAIDWNGITDVEIVADVDAFADQADDELLTKVLPRFEAGMRDINAVTSSAFVIGKAIIEGMRDRDVAKHSSILRLDAVNKNLESDIKKEELRVAAAKSYLSYDLGKESINLQAGDQVLKAILSKYSWKESYARLVIESNRMKIVAKKEETDLNLEIGERSATWDLEVFQYGGNLLASIGSGTMVPKDKKKSAVNSAIGGAMTGVAASVMMGAATGSAGGPIGVIGGAVVGAAIGLLAG